MGPEIFYIIGGVILGIGIAYGFIAYRTRNKRNDPITEAATRELYDHPKRYERHTKAELDAQTRD